LLRRLITLYGLNPNFDYETRNKKIKIGLILKHLNDDPEFNSVFPFFEKLLSDPDVSFKIYSQNNGSIIKNLLDSVEIIYLPSNFSDSLSYIRHECLDFAMYGNDVTAKMSPLAIMSHMKIARKSGICVSTLTTTCSNHVDYYFAAKFQEKYHLSQEFSEEMIYVPDPGFTFVDKIFSKKISKLNRVTLGFSAQDFIFISGANFHKLNGDLLDTWFSILSKDSLYKLVLYPFPPHYGGDKKYYKELVHGYAKKWKVENQFRLLDTVPKELIGDLNYMSDLSLDSFPYPGVTTVCDSLYVGTPVLCLAGKNIRTSQSECILRSMDMSWFVAENISEYIEKAVIFSKNPYKILDKKMSFLGGQISNTFSEKIKEICR
jgi:predicted O-linked N-acetylglucosamine transferase (SPINDLY family)